MSVTDKIIGQILQYQKKYDDNYDDNYDDRDDDIWWGPYLVGGLHSLSVGNCLWHRKERETKTKKIYTNKKLEHFFWSVFDWF